MARPLRIELSGGLYHVTSRGDRREAIFFGDEDRLAWLELLCQVCKRFNWVCHGWCQMTNHYHLIVETPEGNLSAGMRQLNGVYTQWVNRQHQRVGHVFQGRYKAILVEKDAYLLELARYVVLNPVRAGMVASVDAWPWSSYHATVGNTPAPVWLQTEWILAQFGRARSPAVWRYMEFVGAGVGQASIWQHLTGQVFLGSETFFNQVAAQVATLDHPEIPRAQRRTLAKPLSEYFHGNNVRQGMVDAYASGHFSMQDIATHLGIHYSTVSRAIKKLG